MRSLFLIVVLLVGLSDGFFNVFKETHKKMKDKFSIEGSNKLDVQQGARVDFFKPVGATLQFTEHYNTATWSTPGHDPKPYSRGLPRLSPADKHHQPPSPA
jgi:hypothetical protein